MPKPAEGRKFRPSALCGKNAPGPMARLRASNTGRRPGRGAVFNKYNKKTKTNKFFFTDWLKLHGESIIIKTNRGFPA